MRVKLFRTIAFSIFGWTTLEFCNIKVTTGMKKYNKILYPLHEVQQTTLRAQFNAVAMSLSCQSLWLEMMAPYGLPPQPLLGQTRRTIAATLEMSDRLSKDYPKPEFGITATRIGQDTVAVTQEVAADKTFGSLLHFRRNTERNDPKILIVAPMSGHYATLLRDMVTKLLPDHDVYITDWKNARDIPADKGDFGLDDYITYVKDFIGQLGPDTHLVAISQSTVPTLAAVALLAKEKLGCQPLSMTFMGGPLDTRAAPTVVTRLAEKKSIDWFAENMIGEVPDKYAGAGRLVYPGFLQLFSFMAMHPEEHTAAHLELFNHLSLGNKRAADKIKAFYDEYLAVCDLPEKFYLETLQKVFIDQELARGLLTHAGVKVDPSAITRTALLTIEGGKDDIVAPGQTTAAHALCSGLAQKKKFHHLQKDAGHFGLFSGHSWNDDIALRLMSFVRKAGADNGIAYDPAADPSRLVAPAQWQDPRQIQPQQRKYKP